MKAIIISLVILVNGVAYAQFGINTPWTWMKGSDQVASYGNYGQQGVESALNEPIARFSAVTFTDLSGNLWMYGGMSYLPAPAWWYFDDVWKYNPATNNWTWMKGSNDVNQQGNYGAQGVASPLNSPGARIPAASWTDKIGRFWIFGGDAYILSTWTYNMNDLWMFDPSTNNWTWVKGSMGGSAPGDPGTMGIPSISNLPAGRYGSASWTDAEGNLWLFGGAEYMQSHDLTDLWKYDVTNNTWTWINGPISGPAVYGTMGVPSSANNPGPRIGATTWRAGNKLFLFGGLHMVTPTFSYFNDLWCYDISTNQWTWLKGSQSPNQMTVPGTQGLPSSTANPGARWEARSFTDISGNLFLHGGSIVLNGFSYQYNDLWKYDINSNEWTWLRGRLDFDVPGIYGTQGIPSINNLPGSRASHMTWSDQAGNFWLFGGTGADINGIHAELNDLWKINGLALIPVSLTNFTGQKQDGDIRLNWEVQNTSDLQKFYIQRSLNQRDFQTIDSVNYYSVQTRYEFTDPLTDVASQNIYYRLKLSSSSGEQSFSNILHFKFAELIHSKIYPNPASNLIHADLDHAVSSNDSYQLIDAGGKTISQRRIKNIAGNRITIDVSNLVKGAYLLKIITANRTSIKRFIKQ